MTSKHPAPAPSRGDAPRASVLVVEERSSAAQEIAKLLVALGYEVAGVASSAPEALDLLSARVPDAAVLSAQFASPADLVDLSTVLREKYLVPVVCLTARTDSEALDLVKGTSPVGCVTKPFDEGQLRATIELALHAGSLERARRREVAGEKAKLHDLEMRTALLEARLREIAGLVSDPAGERTPAEAEPGVEERFRGLSRREIEIVRMLSDGRRVAAIARDLDLSVHTVRNHLRAIFRKLDLHSQEELLDTVRGVPPGLLGM
jgi:DNA-binding NarL/FixJ family response regulator